jgi:hypothetical protein
MGVVIVGGTIFSLVLTLLLFTLFYVVTNKNIIPNLNTLKNMKRC